MKNLLMTIFVLFITLVSIMAQKGCLSTPFEVAGDVLDATFSTAGAIAEVPFDVLSSGVSIPNGYNCEAERSNETWFNDIEAVDTLDAQTENGAISIQGSDDRSTIGVKYRIEVHGRSQRAVDEFMPKVDVEMKVEGETLRVYARYPHPPRNVWVSVHYDIQVPRETLLKLKSTNGSIQMKDIQGDIFAETTNAWIGLTRGQSHADLRTTNGAITVEEFRGFLKASTSNADIRLRDVQGDIFTESTNGRICMKETSGKVIAHTSNGEIDADLLFLRERGEFTTTNGKADVDIASGVAPIYIHTENASIDLALPPDYPATLNAYTSHARIHAEIPVTVREYGKDRLQGRIGAGGVTEVRLESTNGEIHVRESSAAGAPDWQS